MGRRVSDEREHRRGLILGLTLAEVLLLLLFVLLLVLGRKIQFYKSVADEKTAELSVAVDTLKPIQDALANSGDGSKSISELVQRLARIQQLEKTVAQLKEDNTTLNSQMTAVKSLGTDTQKQLREVSAAIQQAAKIDPDDPPAALKRAVAVLDKLGAKTAPDDVKPLSEMVADANLKEKLDTTRAESEKFRQQRDNLMRSGNGRTLPSCWTLPNGATEYMFDVTTVDSGLIVKDATPTRANDAAWKYVDAFPRGSVINERLFVQSTAKLFAYSNQQNCRFYSVLRDGTGPQSKERYKALRRIVEGHFYILAVSKPIVVAPADPAPEPAPSEPKQPTTPSFSWGLPWLNTSKPDSN